MDMKNYIECLGHSGLIKYWMSRSRSLDITRDETWLKHTHKWINEITSDTKL